jgi:hypothetical protein
MSADFMSHFAPIPEPRIERCKRHERLDILFVSLSAVLCGAEGWEERERILATPVWSGGATTFPMPLAFPVMTPLPACSVVWTPRLCRGALSAG